MPSASWFCALARSLFRREKWADRGDISWVRPKIPHPCFTKASRRDSKIRCCSDLVKSPGEEGLVVSIRKAGLCVYSLWYRATVIYNNEPLVTQTNS